MNQKIMKSFIKVEPAANKKSEFKVNRTTNTKQFFEDLGINALTADEEELEMVEVKIRMPFGVISGKFWGPKVTNFFIFDQKSN